MEKQRIIFIVNPISGTQSKDTIVELIKKRIDKDKYDFDIIPTRFAGHAVELTATAAAEGAAVVVAIGGDGTVNEVARSLVHTDTALGIIPCGSGNGLARHLQIPLNLREAVDVINEGATSCIDYGTINSIPFFCTCGVGFDAFVSQKFAESGRRGPLTYLENMLHECLSYKPETYNIELCDGNEVTTLKAYLIACANASQYGNNAYIAPQASLHDGLIDVTVVEPFTVLDVPALAFQLFNRTIDQNSRIKTFRCRKLRIHRAKEGVIHFDGDPVMTGRDLEVQVVPKALNIIVNSKKRQKFKGPESLLQTLSDYLVEVNTIRNNIQTRNKRWLEMNRELLLRKLTKK